MTRHLGVRLAQEEMVRATVATSLGMSQALGGGRKEAPALRHVATQLLLAQLRMSCLHIEPTFVDAPKGMSGTVDDDVLLFRGWRNKHLAPAYRHLPDRLKQLHVEAALIGVDGGTALQQGRTGAVCSAAIAEPGVFKEPPSPTDASLYLVFTLGKHALTRSMIHALARGVRHAHAMCGGLDQPLCVQEFFSRCELGHLLAAQLSTSGTEPIVGITLEGSNYAGWRPMFRNPVLIRKLDGSAVVNSLTALMGKVTAGLCIARSTQVIQMSVATKAMGGRLYALPLVQQPSDQPNIRNVLVDCSARIYRENAFVGSGCSILVVSSISELCLLDRVRMTGPGRASVESFVVGASHETSELRLHDIELSKLLVRSLEHTDTTADRLMGSIRKLVSQPSVRKITKKARTAPAGS